MNNLPIAGIAAASTLPAGWEIPATVTLPALSPWFRELGKRFAAVRGLEDGWDGPQSVSVERLLIGRVDRFLKDALFEVPDPMLPFVVPAADGSLQIEWHRRDLDLEVFFSREGHVSALLEDRKAGVELERDGAEALNLFFGYARRVATNDRDGAHAPVAPASASVSVAA
jgi:hypothetical protein